jgi:ABC-type multidrug transport system permease subunit
MATPVDAIDALVGNLSPYIFVGVVQAALIIWIARLLFNLPLEGDVVGLLLSVPLYSAAHLILGFALSALAENQLQAIQGARPKRSTSVSGEVSVCLVFFEWSNFESVKLAGVYLTQFGGSSGTKRDETRTVSRLPLEDL